MYWVQYNNYLLTLWQIYIAEDGELNLAFYTVKRLLGLSYLWTGSINGVFAQRLPLGEVTSVGNLALLCHIS